MNKKAIILARVSTEQQSLESQLERLKEEARRYGYNEDDITIIAGKESGLKQDIEERETLKELHRYIDTGIYDMVFIWEVSRLSRQPSLLFEEVDYLTNKQVNLHCITPQFTMLKDDGSIDATAELVLSIFGTIAKEEARIFKERTKRGRKNKLSENKYIGGSLLFGYKVEKETDKIIIDKEDAKTVIEIYERYIKNESIRSIAIDLMDRGLLRYASNDTARCMVRRILTASEYAGIRTTSYEYPQIISKKLYEQAQSRKGTKCRSNNDNVYYCKSLIHWKKNRLTLSPMVARNIYGVKDENTDDRIYVNMNFMDSLLLDIVVKHRDSMKGTNKKKMINEILDRMQQNNQKSQKATEDIEEISNTIDRINERIVKGKLSETKGDKMIDDQNKLFTKLTADIRSYQDENKELDRELDKIMKGGNADYKNMDDKQKYDIIHEDVYDILIEKDNIKRGGKYIEVILKDTTIFKYHLVKYGNYDILYIIENGKETRVDDLEIKKRFKAK